MGPLLARLKDWWDRADGTQRMVTVFGVAALCILLAGTAFLASRPKMAVLFNDLSSADQGMVVDEIQTMGLPVEYGPGGQVLVPAAKMAEIRARLATAQKLPTSGHSGYESFKDMGIMNTPRVEQERIKVAVEGELANSIESLDGVGAARVHITLGDTSPFARESKPPTASVVITETSPGSMGSEHGETIARLVQDAVGGMPAENLTIISSTGTMLYDGATMAGGQGSADRRLRTEIAEARRREKDLQTQLDVVLGRGNSVVSVPILELNYDESNVHEIKRTPSGEPIVREINKEEMTDAGKPAAGAAGAASNTPSTPDTTSTGGDARGYTGTQEATEFLQNEKTTTTTQATGQLKRMAINVIVNSDAVTDMGPIDSLLERYLGPLADDPNFTAQATSIPFDTKAATELQAAQKGAASAERMQQLISLAPVGVLLLLGVMVLKSLGKMGKGAPGGSEVVMAALPDGTTIPLRVGEQGMEAALSKALEASYAAGVQGTAEPKVVVYGADGKPIEGAALPQGGGRSVEFVDEGNEHLSITKIKERVNVPLEQVKRLATEKPEAVANLMKTWILEEKR